MTDNALLFENLPKTEVSETAVDHKGDFEILVDIIGFEAAWKVLEAFAGASIYLPKTILIEKKYEVIRAKYNAGVTYRELAAEYGYTNGHIRYIIHKR